MPELVPCAGCALVCDGFTLEQLPECGRAWFDARAAEPELAASVDGAATDADAALQRAAELLRGARAPLITGFGHASTEAVRAAVALADRLGAAIDVAHADGFAGEAVALRGASTATLGEVRDRAGVLVIWGEDPETTHPRLLERLRPRRLVVVDDRDTPTTARADVHVRLPAADHVDARPAGRADRASVDHLAARPAAGADPHADRASADHLAARPAAGADPHADRASADHLAALMRLHARVAERAASASPALDDALAPLLDALRSTPHVSFVHGPRLGTTARNVLALHELVRALSRERHAVTLRLRADAGVTGAEDVLAWQTGFASKVDLASGHPQSPREAQPDVVLAVEAPPPNAPGARVIALSSVDAQGDVVVRTAGAGVGVGGTVHRLDGVPIALAAPVATQRPGAAKALRTIAEALA